MFSFQENSPNAAAYRVAEPRAYTANDITAVICIRAGEHNPWVLERLAVLSGFYDPAPRFLIVDFGSAPPFASQIAEICREHSFRYHRIEDDGVFSNGIGRNRGAELVATDLIWFTDIDIVAAPDLFGRLASIAQTQDFHAIRDIVLVAPVGHLLEKHSAEFLRCTPSERSRYLAGIGALAEDTPRGQFAEFVAPYSNIFLCTRDFFHLSGGYNDVFRGHGSEDFELLVRFAYLNHQFELPKDLEADCHSPKRRWFYRPRPYVGFRRLCEAMSFRAEREGLRVFHLWHPTPERDAWRAGNDWTRRSMTRVLADYVNDPSRLLHHDFLQREKTVLCLYHQAGDWGYCLPFRALGFKLLTRAESSPQNGAHDDTFANAAHLAIMVNNASTLSSSTTQARPQGAPLVRVRPAENTGEFRYEGSHAGASASEQGNSFAFTSRLTLPNGTTSDTAMVTAFRWNGRSLPLGRACASSQVGATSYTNARLGLGIGAAPGSKLDRRADSRGSVSSFLLNRLATPARYGLATWRRLNTFCR